MFENVTVVKDTKTLRNLFGFVKLDNRDYVVIEVIPSRVSKNNNTKQLLSMLNSTFKPLSTRFTIKDNSLNVSYQNKLSFYIHCTKDSVSFFFIVPNNLKRQVITKAKELWSGSTIKEIEEIPNTFKNTLNKELVYQKHDNLSLHTDARDNNLLDAKLNVMNQLEDDDFFGVIYNFVPMNSYNQISTRSDFKLKNNTYIKNKDDLLNNASLKDYGISLFKFFIEILSDVASAFGINITLPWQLEDRTISPSTTLKQKSELIRGEVITSSFSRNNTRKHSISNSLDNSFLSLAEDNKFVSKVLKKEIGIKDVRLAQRSNVFSVKEAQEFVAIPSAEIIKKFNINYVQMLEKPIHQSLIGGWKWLGKVTHNNTTVDATFSTNKQISRRSTFYLGATGSGKTTKLQKDARCIVENGHGLFVLDFIKECELSDAIEKVTPKDKLVIIDCADTKKLQSLAFNEFKIPKNADEHEKMSRIYQKSEQLIELLNLINLENVLSSKMERYLHSACILGFYINPNASLKNICDILTNVKIRLNLIVSLSNKDRVVLKAHIDDLEELTSIKVNKTGEEIIENKDIKVEGIIDRISKLKKNYYTNLAFEKDADYNVDFVECIKENKVVLIKIREKEFKNKNVKNFLSTFFLTKIWLAKQELGSETEPNRTELFIDEIHQCPNVQIMLQYILVENRKFNLVITLSMHYISQCNNALSNSILNSNGAFFFFHGVSPKAFTDLSVSFSIHGFAMEDIATLKPHHSLCLIPTENGTTAFIADLTQTDLP